MKIKYERPLTELHQIEMEGGFCAASQEKIEDSDYNVTINDQEEESDFTISSWD